MTHALAICLATFLGATEAATLEPCHELLALAASHRDARVRQGAVRALETLQWKPTSEADWKLLAACGTETFPLIERSLKDPDPKTRGRCCQVLARIGGKKGTRQAALELLLARSAREREASVLKVCAKALVAIGWPASGKECHALFSRRPVPWPLVDALLELPRGPHISAMLRELNALARQPETAAEAKKRLELARKRIPPDQMARQLVQDNWRPATNQDWLLLSSLGTNSMPLFDRLLADQDPAVRLRAIAALSQLADAQPKARLEAFKRLCSVALAKKTDPRVREAAVEALTALKGPTTPAESEVLASHGEAAVPLLGRLLASQDPNTRSCATACLASIAKANPKLRLPIANQLLAVSLEEKNPDARDQAFRSLAELGWPRDPAELANAAKQEPRAWDALKHLAARTDAAPRLVGMLATLAAAGKPSRAFAVLASIADDPKAGKARAAAIAGLERLARDAAPATQLKALDRLVTIAGKDQALRKKISGFLADRLSAKLEPRLREVVLRGLARLGWAPADASQERKLVALGPAALAITEPLVRHPDPAIRRKALGIISQIVRQHEEARDVGFAQLAAIAQDASDKALSEEATRVLRAMGWPRTDADWADLVKLGPRAEPLLLTLISDKSEEVRGRAAMAIAQVASKEERTRPTALVALLRLVVLDHSTAVREAAMAGLSRLGWPASQAEWAVVEKLRCKALGPLAWLVRNAPDDLKEKAKAKARALCPALLAEAEIRVDQESMLEGLELRWELDFEARQEKILATAGKNQLDLVATEFRQALKEAEETDEKVNDLAITLSRWPLAGVADKWKALADLLENKTLEPFRKSRPLTAGNWRATLHKRSNDLATWREAFRQVATTSEPKGKLDRLNRFLTANPQSHYARFAWKWKDILSRKARGER